ncbi:MAG: acetate/propionate family kinase [Pseudomonadota bacterium]
MDVVLTINAGSSSLKFALHPVSDISRPVLRGKISGLKRAPVFILSIPEDTRASMPEIPVNATHESATAILLDWLDTMASTYSLYAVGHRVVHGGTDFAAPVRITGSILEALDGLAPLAPLHQPHNLSPIRQIAARMPDLAQIACFDTGFHTTQSPVERLFALPKTFAEQGVLRYGFHGLSYDCIASILPEKAPDASRVIVAHLGNGASLCAMENGKSVATTMSFTALDGLVMGRRCGAIDPGVILHLVKQHGMSVPDIERLLYQQSGLLGVSGISNAMQDLEASDHPDAALAIDLFCARAAGEIAKLIPALGGLDGLVFTAGIGENSALVRAKICSRLAWLDLQLALDANETNDERISTEDSAVPVFVIPTNEEAVIAKSALALM